MKLETAIALKEKGFPQELKFGDWTYCVGYKTAVAHPASPNDTSNSTEYKQPTYRKHLYIGENWDKEYVRIPTTDELLAWGKQKGYAFRIKISNYSDDDNDCSVNLYSNRDIDVPMITVREQGLIEAIAQAILKAVGG